MQEKRPRGRPAGTVKGQTPAQERNRKSRVERAKAGAMRLDITLDPTSSEQFLKLMQHWKSPTRKEAIERAIASAYRTIHPTENDTPTEPHKD